tara:strand:- start:142 stop:354 length:213 start_codon:yes stop_codon:yes gene_type:complete
MVNWIKKILGLTLTVKEVALLKKLSDRKKEGWVFEVSGRGALRKYKLCRVCQSEHISFKFRDCYECRGSV